MTFTSRVRAAAERSVLWALLLPVRILVESLAFLINRLIGGQDRDGRQGPRSERATEDVFAESVIGRKASTSLTGADRAWEQSATHRLVGRALRPWSDIPATERTQLAGLTTIVASLTALVLRYAAYPPAPLTWVVPLIGAVCGAGILVFAKRH